MTWTLKDKLFLWLIVLPGAIAALVLIVSTGLWLPILLVMILIAICRKAT